MGAAPSSTATADAESRPHDTAEYLISTFVGDKSFPLGSDFWPKLLQLPLNLHWPSHRVQQACELFGNDTNGQNDWKGAWWHNSLTTHSGFIEEDSPYAQSNQKGTYYFEFSRPLRTLDRLQQDVQFRIGESSKFSVAFWYPLDGNPLSFIHDDAAVATTMYQQQQGSSSNDATAAMTQQQQQRRCSSSNDYAAAWTMRQQRQRCSSNSNTTAMTQRKDAATTTRQQQRSHVRQQRQ